MVTPSPPPPPPPPNQIKNNGPSLSCFIKTRIVGSVDGNCCRASTILGLTLYMCWNLENYVMSLFSPPPPPPPLSTGFSNFSHEWEELFLPVGSSLGHLSMKKFSDWTYGLGSKIRQREGAGGSNQPPSPTEQKLTYFSNHEDDNQS